MEKPMSFYGQISYTELTKALKEGKTEAKKVTTKKGEELMVSVVFWVKEQPDEYNNNASMQVQLKEEFRAEKAPYLGNFKHIIPKAQTATQEDINSALNDAADIDSVV